MKNWFNRNYRTLIISTFLIPIITVAVVSISHVTKWYGISNPFIWAAYLSIGIEIAALSALAAISANMGKNVYFPFGIVTLIQFIGNIYYTYFFIEIDSKSFISWVELVSPLIEFIGVESTDLVGHKRFLAVFSGGMLPLISLSFLHMLVKFTEEDRVKFSNKIEDQKDINSKKETNIIESKELISEVSRVRFSEEDLNYLENFLLKKNNITKEKEEIIEDKTTTTIINPEITDDVVKIPEPISVSFNTLLPNIDVIEEENIILEEEQIEEENIILEEEQIEEDNIVQEDEELEKENIVQEEEVEEENIILEEEQMEEENIVQEEENIIQEENSNITVESEEKKKNHS
jgi:hypothetical protein